MIYDKNSKHLKPALVRPARVFLCLRFVMLTYPANSCAASLLLAAGISSTLALSLTDCYAYLQTAIAPCVLAGTFSFLLLFGFVMAAFSVAFNRTMKNEGGYVLHEVAGDRGGMTFAGIARKFNSSWSGWQLVDAGDRDSAALKKSVASFYLNNYFNACGLKHIKSQVVANVVYDFAVNAGVRSAVSLVQQCVGVDADGIVGPVTIYALNDVDGDVFVSRYALAKVARYAAIVSRDRTQSKFLLGWVNRTLRDLESL